MEHLKEIILGIYRLNLIGGDKEVNRFLREKFPEWKYSFDTMNLELLARMSDPTRKHVDEHRKDAMKPKKNGGLDPEELG